MLSSIFAAISPAVFIPFFMAREISSRSSPPAGCAAAPAERESAACVPPYFSTYSAQFLSCPESARKAATAAMFSGALGLRMGQSSPANSAAVRKEVFTKERQGSPKEMLLTPRTVRTPYFFFTAESALSVSSAWPCSALAVSVRQSI